MAWFKTRQVTYADVVRAYGRILEEPAEGVALTHPASKLPYEEGLIKEAICQVATDGRGTATRDQLKAGFMQLATFLEDHDSRKPPEMPTGDLSKEERIAFLEKVKDVLGNSTGRSNAIAKRMSELGHEFEARCQFIEVARNA